jgi:hypothetical protein
MELRNILVGAVAALPIMLFGAANASVVYDNGGPNGVNGNEFAQWVQTEDFTLGSTAKIGGATIDVFSLGVSAYTPITYYIFGDSSGAPGGVLATGTASVTSDVATGLTDAGAPVDAITFNFATPFVAAAGTTYHLGIHSSNAFDRLENYWATTNGNGTTTGIESDGGTFNNWSDNGQEHAFTLNGGVPEPAMWAMMLVGFGAVGLTLRGGKKTGVATA